MKKDLFKHLLFFFSLFVLVTLVKRYFSFSYWPFWVGGIFGTLLPDIDHLLHVFVFKPEELTSQRVKYLLSSKQYREALSLIYDTQTERQNLIFHTQQFQIIFIVLTFWLMSSSGGFFGRGLTLAFFLHLVVDNLNDIKSRYTQILLVLLLIFSFWF